MMGKARRQTLKLITQARPRPAQFDDDNDDGGGDDDDVDDDHITFISTCSI